MDERRLYGRAVIRSPYHRIAIERTRLRDVFKLPFSAEASLSLSSHGKARVDTRSKRVSTHSAAVQVYEYCRRGNVFTMR